MEVLAFGRIEDGILKISNRKAFIKEISLLQCKEVEICIRKKKKYRSFLQNRYYWGLVIPVVRASLHDVGVEFGNQTTHEMLKLRFLKEDLHVRDGEFISRIKSTKELSTSEFMDYIAQIQRWASEFLGCVIPDPGEQACMQLT